MSLFWILVVILTIAYVVYFTWNILKDMYQKPSGQVRKTETFSAADLSAPSPDQVPPSSAPDSENLQVDDSAVDVVEPEESGFSSVAVSGTEQPASAVPSAPSVTHRHSFASAGQGGWHTDDTAQPVPAEDLSDEEDEEDPVVAAVFDELVKGMDMPVDDIVLEYHDSISPELFFRQLFDPACRETTGIIFRTVAAE